MDRAVKRPRPREQSAPVLRGSIFVTQFKREGSTAGGCDNSLNRHATRHAQRTGHPVIASAEPEERWLYCYPDQELAQY